MTSDVWVEIDLAAIAHNINELKKSLKPSTRLMAVVKANAYGHGLVQVSRQVLAAGSDYLGVARFGEAMQLRQAGIAAPILIFGYTPPELTEELVANNLIQTIYTYETAKAMAERAKRLKKPLIAHLKVDTGMGRLGIVVGNRNGEASDVSPAVIDEIRAINNLPGLCVEGMYTHFATADQVDKTYATKQFELFQRLKAALADAEIKFEICHAANSAAIIDMPETHMDMVRAGISVYGLYPSNTLKNNHRLALVPAMALKSRVIHLKTVDAGFFISYGATAKTTRPTTIATVSIGYADGYNRLLSNSGRMLVRGISAPVIGRVCMDQTMLDVGHIPGVCLGDEVLAFGRNETGDLPVAEVAEVIGTISYEVVSGISDRVERRYRNPNH